MFFQSSLEGLSPMDCERTLSLPVVLCPWRFAHKQNVITMLFVFCLKTNKKNNNILDLGGLCFKPLAVVCSSDFLSFLSHRCGMFCSARPLYGVMDAWRHVTSAALVAWPVVVAMAAGGVHTGFWHSLRWLVELYTDMATLV